MKKFLKKWLCVVLAMFFCFLFGCTVSPSNSASGQEGKLNQLEIPSGFTRVTSAKDLDNIRNNSSGNYILTKDVDLSSWGNWEPINITGVFDGNGFSIKGVSMQYSDTGLAYWGIFGEVEGNGVVKNLSLIDTSIDIITHPDKHCGIVGGIVGYLGEDAVIENCSFSGNIKVISYQTAWVGGIVGEALGIIRNSSNAGTISAISDQYGVTVGGISGHGGTIVDCYNAGTLASNETIGGIVGNGGYESIDNSIVRCYNTGEITVSTAYSAKCGGIVGYWQTRKEARIEDCYNIGFINISAQSSIAIGGIAGQLFNVSIMRCYNVGEMDIEEFSSQIRPSIGGIVGSAYCQRSSPKPVIEECYYVNSISSVGDIGGTGSWEYTITNITSFGTHEMRYQETFVGFDFDTIWGIDTTTNGGYPYLKNTRT